MSYVALPMFEARAQHHERRAAMWRARGREEYALGSDLKAKKWRDLQDVLAEAMKPSPYCRLAMVTQEKIDESSARIEREMMRLLTGAHD